MTSVDTFSLTNGIQTINFEDGDSNVWVSYGTPETFFVVIESRDELDETNPTQFRIGHLSDAVQVRVLKTQKQILRLHWLQLMILTVTS